MFLATSSSSSDVVIRGSICTFDTPMATSPSALPRKRQQKHVRWGTVTALEFRIGYNACSVPGSAGPPVGLLGGPIRYTVSSLQHDEHPQEQEQQRNQQAASRGWRMSDSSTSDSDDDDDDASEAQGGSTASRRRSKQDLWLCPMDRVKILNEEAGLLVEEITAICSDVNAVLDARALSKFDHVAYRIMETLEMSRHDDLRTLRETFRQDNRKKIMLF